MKKVIFILTASALFLSGAMFTGCQSPDQKVDSAQVKADNAQKDLKDVQKAAELQRATNAEEWKIFKSESEIKIKENESAIAALKEKMTMAGKKMDAVYGKKIDDLEQKNRNLQARMEVYDKGQSEWEVYKREFSHDMDELGQALKDLGVDNKK